MTKEFDVISFGSAIVDVFVDTELSETGKKICVPVGEKIAVNNIKFMTGGGGTNTSAALATLGLKAGFLGKIGKGHNAGLILKDLEKHKVNFIGVVGDHYEYTGYSVIIDSKQRNRTILTYRGINNTLRFNEVNLSKLRTKWFYFSSMLGESFKTQEKLAVFARREGVKIAYNPSTAQAKAGARHIGKILKNTEILILNKEEAESIIKKGDLFEGLRKLGPKLVCITNGEKGSRVYDGTYLYTAVPRKVVRADRTGAGDAFGSSFLAGIILYNNIEKAMQLACVNAESVIQIPGAKNGLLTLKEAEKIMKQRPVRVRKELY